MVLRKRVFQHGRVSRLHLIEEKFVTICTFARTLILSRSAESAVCGLHDVIIVDEMYIRSSSFDRRSQRLIHCEDQFIHPLSPSLREILSTKKIEPNMPGYLIACVVGSIEELSVASVVSVFVSELQT